MRLNTPEQTREKIMRTAFEEFYQHGFQGGSINRIVERAGITKGALFHHFKGKDELGYQVVDEVIRPHIESIWIQPLNRSIDPVTDIIAILNQLKDSEEDRLCQGCPLNNLAQEMSPLDDEFRRRVNAVYDAWRRALADALERGVKAGTVRPGISPQNVSAFVVSALAGMVGTAKNAQSVELLHSAGQALVDYLESLRS